MKDVPNKLNTVALAINNTSFGGMAIDTRRRILQIPEISISLKPVEKYIFEASTKNKISDFPDEELVNKTAKMFRFIAIDVGYIIPNDKDEWAYIQTRIVDILKRYYSFFTLADIKLAFELATTGELDDYLPKDKQGNPDKNHYQQFNVDYFGKILNAYKRKQNVVFDKVFKLLPTPQSYITPEKIKKYEEMRRLRNRQIFLEYKYTGKLNLILSDLMFVYEWLRKCDIADEVKISEEDRKEALSRYMQRVARGMIDRYTAFHVRRKGTKSPEIDGTACEVAQRKEIIKAFDRMIAEEMQVDNYMKF